MISTVLFSMVKKGILIILMFVLTIISTAVTSSTATAATPECSSKAYSYFGWKVKSTFEWYYNPAGAPAGLVNPLATIQKSIQTAFGGVNGCSIKGINVQQLYKGVTTVKPQVLSPTVCGSMDGRNVVGWGKMPSAIARTCWWATSSTLKQADILINTTYTFFSGNIPAGCNGEYDLQSLVVHEFGHVLGLDHVADVTQVMFTRPPACAIARRTFMSGDMLGLHKIYG